VGALIARMRLRPESALPLLAEARELARGQNLDSFQVYATAIEAAIRADLGDLERAAELATEAFVAVEAMEGSEYGIEIRSLCCDAARRADCARTADEPHGGGALGASAAGPSRPSLSNICRRASLHVEQVSALIRDPVFVQRFRSRPPVQLVLQHAGAATSRRGSLQSG
jgi:hypothetical protein